MRAEESHLPRSKDHSSTGAESLRPNMWKLPKEKRCVGRTHATAREARADSQDVAKKKKSMAAQARSRTTLRLGCARHTGQLAAGVSRAELHSHHVTHCRSPVPVAPTCCHPDRGSWRSWHSLRARGQVRARNLHPRPQWASCAGSHQHRPHVRAGGSARTRGP
jgi:hypothetical protein